MSQPEKLSSHRSAWGGARPGAGRKKGGRNRPPPELLEIRRLLEQVSSELAISAHERRKGNATMELMLRKLTALERQRGVIEPHEAPGHTRRRPLGL
jgi:hypothetical protein